MSKPIEYKSVQAHILTYSDEIGWTIVSQTEAENRRVHEIDFEKPKEELLMAAEPKMEYNK